jgi:hypothetical protein
MVNATTSDGNSSDTTNQGGEMERRYKDDGYTTRMNRLEIKRSGLYEIQDHTSRSTTNDEHKYPQVRKTGVDAVHESCPQMVNIMQRIVICNMCKNDD